MNKEKFKQFTENMVDDELIPIEQNVTLKIVHFVKRSEVDKVVDNPDLIYSEKKQQVHELLPDIRCYLESSREKMDNSDNCYVLSCAVETGVFDILENFMQFIYDKCEQHAELKDIQRNLDRLFQQ